MKEHSANLTDVDHRAFTTEDVYLAGALIAQGKKFLSLYWKRGKVKFELSDPIGSAQLSQGFYDGEMRVSAKSFSEALKYLKGQVSEAVRRQKAVQALP